METKRTIKELMVDVFHYPHMPFWFSLRQAVNLMKITVTSMPDQDPLPLLIFDERYNLRGIVSIRELLKALTLNPSANLEQSGVDLLERQIGDFMNNLPTSLELSTTAIDAAGLMINEGVALMPVLDDKKHLVGVVTIQTVFTALADEILGD
jgi:CBS domain-containing protein